MADLSKVIVFLGLVLGAAISSRAADLDSPTHTEVEPLKFAIGSDGKIETMAMDAKGRLLCGVSWTLANKQESPRQQFQNPRRRPGGTPREEPREYAIKVVDGTGKVLETWPMKTVHPKMIHGCEDGTIYVGGHGKLAQLDANGKLLKLQDTAKILNGDYKGAHISGVTANEKYFFVAFGDGFSLRATEDIVRFNRDFSEPKLIVKRQFGCCSHLDLDTKGDLLLIAENSRHRINRYNFEGEQRDTWGQRDRQSLKGFAACCNPVNVDFGPDGVLYTAESGVGRVKKYTPDGKYLGLVGYVDTTVFDRGSRLASQSCYIPVEVNHDASRIYIMDVRAHIIRVLAENPIQRKPK